MHESLTARALITRLLTRSRVPASSVIGRLDYNWLTHRLQVTFKRGEVYSYQGVPWRVARDLERASDGAASVGHVFNASVRDQFRFTRTA